MSFWLVRSLPKLVYGGICPPYIHAELNQAESCSIKNHPYTNTKCSLSTLYKWRVTPPFIKGLRAPRRTLPWILLGELCPTKVGIGS